MHLKQNALVRLILPFFFLCLSSEFLLLLRPLLFPFFCCKKETNKENKSESLLIERTKKKEDEDSSILHLIRLKPTRKTIEKHLIKQRTLFLFISFQQRERVAGTIHRQETVDCLRKFNARRKLKVNNLSPIN